MDRIGRVGSIQSDDDNLMPLSRSKKQSSFERLAQGLCSRQSVAIEKLVQEMRYRQPR